MLGNRAVIVAIGPVSTQFTEHFVRAVLQGPPHHGLFAVGIYDDEVAGSRVRRAIRNLIAHKDIEEISVSPTLFQRAQYPRLDALVDLKQRVEVLSPSRVFLVTDASYMGDERLAGVIRDLRIESRQIEMTALCFTNDRTEVERAGHAQLLTFTQPDEILETAPILEGVFLAKVNSPLAKTVGGASYQNQLLATSLAGIWSGPLYRNYNASLREQISLLNPAGGLVGLGIAPKGLTMERGRGPIASLRYFLYRKSLKRITIEWASKNLIILTRSVLTNHLEQSHLDPTLKARKGVDVDAATTTVQPFDQTTIKQQPALVNLIVPFRSNDDRFEPIRSRVQQGLTDEGYQVIHTGMVTGKGVNLSHNPKFSAWKGAFYCQVCVLFSASINQISAASGALAVAHSPHDDAQPDGATQS